MLAESRTLILEQLVEDDLVLDVGGGARPFTRADWVLDLMPYEARATHGSDGDGESERFTADTWVRRDICARTPWPFADGQFDFSVCSHTLEDVRDPVFVCQELIRVSRAGYVEVPSRLEEQTYGFQGPWVGWSHHRWLIDLDEDELTFVFKPHVLHGRPSDQFPTSFRDGLNSRQRVLCLWWRGSFRFRERVFLEASGLDAYLAELVARQGTPRTRLGTGPARLNLRAWRGARGRRR